MGIWHADLQKKSSSNVRMLQEKNEEVPVKGCYKVSDKLHCKCTKKEDCECCFCSAVRNFKSEIDREKEGYEKEHANRKLKITVKFSRTNKQKSAFRTDYTHIFLRSVRITEWGTVPFEHEINSLLLLSNKDLLVSTDGGIVCTRLEGKAGMSILFSIKTGGEQPASIVSSAEVSVGHVACLGMSGGESIIFLADLTLGVMTEKDRGRGSATQLVRHEKFDRELFPFLFFWNDEGQIKMYNVGEWKKETELEKVFRNGANCAKTLRYSASHKALIAADRDGAVHFIEVSENLLIKRSLF